MFCFPNLDEQTRLIMIQELEFDLRIGLFYEPMSMTISGLLVYKRLLKECFVDGTPETFAEEFTREIVNNLEYFKLRLTRNPFPLAKNNPTLQQILYETWEGLIADGKGLI